MEGRESVAVTGGGAGEVEPLHPPQPSETLPASIPVSSPPTTTSLLPSPPVPVTSSPSPLAPPPVAKEDSVLNFIPSSDAKLKNPTQNRAEGEIMAIKKKKRGRPRKYGADGSVLLNPIPISASMPSSGEFTLTSPEGVMLKRGRGRPIGSVTKNQHFHQRKKFNQQYRGHAVFDSSDLGGVVACSSGANLTPHIITVATGEDVTMKIISFSQKGSQAICILSANGVISNVTLRQPDSSGGTLTYEGRFELLSLSGCFKPSETGGTRNLSGGMSVSLAGPDGRVVGGGLAGLLVAAGPVQVVVGSFMPSNSNKGAYAVRVKKKSQSESFSMNVPTATVGTGRSIVDIDESYGIIRGGQQRSSGSPKGNGTSFRTADNNWSASAVTNTTDTNGSQLSAGPGSDPDPGAG